MRKPLLLLISLFSLLFTGVVHAHGHHYYHHDGRYYDRSGAYEGRMDNGFFYDQSGH